jgi:hypothetical protein
VERLKDRSGAQLCSVATGIEHPLGEAERDGIEVCRMGRDGDQETMPLRSCQHALSSSALHRALLTLRDKALARRCRHDGDRRPGASVRHSDLQIELLGRHPEIGVTPANEAQARELARITGPDA